MKKTGKKSKVTKRNTQSSSLAAVSTLTTMAVLGANTNHAAAYDDWEMRGLDKDTRREIYMLQEQKKEIGLNKTKACLFSGVGVLAAGVAMSIAGGALLSKAESDDSYYYYGSTDDDKKKKGQIIGSVGGGLVLSGAVMTGVCGKRNKQRKKEAARIDRKIRDLKYGEDEFRETDRYSMSLGAPQRGALIRF